jgi:hypothetical protein
MLVTHTFAGARLANDTWGEFTRELFDELCTNE